MAQPAPTPDTLREALRAVTDPASGRDIVAAGLVEGIEVRGGLVQVALLTDRAHAAAMEPVARAAEGVLARQPGVTNAAAVLTAHKPAAPAAPPRAHGHGHGHGPAAGQGPGQRPNLLLPGVGAIVAVASGKGGVGKSTVAVNLAVALARQGHRTGLLDADIYGPSLPRMLGLARKPEVRGQRIMPLDAWGLKAMSIGFLVEEETPMIWRGPMVMSALAQMLREVQWGELDVLVVDMPPGTGDAQLTMAQQVPLAGAVIVSTPQDLALIDARKGLNMFRRVDVPVLGIVENMSYFVAPDTGARYDIFGHGGARKEAERLGAPFLGEVPLVMAIRETSDAGTPIVIAEPDGPHAKVYRDIAARVWDGVKRERAEGGRPPPRIVVE
jgi:ATP-binding protein involved in chromosome partitioning